MELNSLESKNSIVPIVNTCLSAPVPDDCLGVLQKSCPICAYVGKREKRLRLQVDPTVHFVECPQCKGVSADRFPTSDFLKNLYLKPSYRNNSIHLTNHPVITKRLAKTILRHHKYKSANIRILDYGGSSGALASELVNILCKKNGNRENFEATVVDIYQGVTKPEVRFLTVEDFLQNDSEFDLVIASAILEHVTDLGPILAKLFESMSKGGTFYARTPYFVPLVQVFPQLRIDWPYHVHDLGSNFWQRFMNVFYPDLEVIESRTSIVESSILSKPLRTTMAHLFKLPSRIETSFIKRAWPYDGYYWHLVGGWEIHCRKPLNFSK